MTDIALWLVFALATGWLICGGMGPHVAIQWNRDTGLWWSARWSGPEIWRKW